jgi:hypothetical protein
LDGLVVGVPEAGERVGLVVGGTEVGARVGASVDIMEVGVPVCCNEGEMVGSADDGSALDELVDTATASVVGELVPAFGELVAVSLVGELVPAFGELVGIATGKLVVGPITTSLLSVAVLFWLLLFLKDTIRPVADAATTIATTISHKSRFRLWSSALFIFSDDGDNNCSSSSSVS